MKTLIISDIHSNDEALTAVLAHVRRKAIARVYCLGDFVGYGGSPNQVLDRIRRLKARKVFLRGNHDRVAAGFEDGELFNQAARSAALWTRSQLSRPNKHFLVTLPTGPVISDAGDILCHGSPANEDEYIFSELDAARVLEQFATSIIFFGHTHLPVVFTLTPDLVLSGELIREPSTIRLDPANRYLINPGSVGQPRDRNPLASFAIWSPKRRTVQFFRIPYDIAGAQRAIQSAGLPRILGDRLGYGF